MKRREKNRHWGYYRSALNLTTCSLRPFTILGDDDDSNEQKTTIGTNLTDKVN